MTHLAISRTGLAPLRFTGALVSETTTRRTGVKKDRWHVVRVYRTDSGGYVGQVTYMTQWPAENSPHNWAVVCSDARSLGQELSEYNPTLFVVGYPPTEEFDEKQRRLLLDLELRYRNAVSTVLNFPEFAEAV